PLRAVRRGCRSRHARSVPTRRTPRLRSRCAIPARVAGHLTLETAFGLLDSIDDTPGARGWVLRGCLHRPLAVIVMIATYVHGCKGFRQGVWARSYPDGE